MQQIRQIYVTTLTNALSRNYVHLQHHHHGHCHSGHYHLFKCYLESISPPVVVCPIHSKYARGTMNECYRRNIIKANINYMVLRMNLMRMYLIAGEVF